MKTLTAHCYEYDKINSNYGIQTYDLDSLINDIFRACDYKSVYHADVPCFQAKKNSFNAKVVIYFYVNYFL